MQLVNLLLLAGALGAVAHPSGHAHLHRSALAKRNEPPVHKKNVHNRPAALAVTTSDKPTPATSAAASPTPENDKPNKPNNDNKPEESDEFIPFCGGGIGDATTKSKRVTYEQVMYTGNLGTSKSECKWNSNLMLVPNKIAHKYKYVQTYTNVAKEPYQVVCANKMGADGQLTGMFKVDGQEQLIFMLQPGETKTVVADTNTQGVCAFAPNKVPLTPMGQYAGNWAEFDFANTSNKKWSGADCSSLVAQHYDMDVPGCRIDGHNGPSIIYPGGKGVNAYTKGMEELDGIGLNIPAGRAVLEVSVGYSG